jgi:hypothetical protein
MRRQARTVVGNPCALQYIATWDRTHDAKLSPRFWSGARDWHGLSKGNAANLLVASNNVDLTWQYMRADPGDRHDICIDGTYMVLPVAA